MFSTCELRTTTAAHMWPHVLRKLPLARRRAEWALHSFSSVPRVLINASIAVSSERPLGELALCIATGQDAGCTHASCSAHYALRLVETSRARRVAVRRRSFPSAHRLPIRIRGTSSARLSRMLSDAGRSRAGSPKNELAVSGPLRHQRTSALVTHTGATVLRAVADCRPSLPA